MEKWEKWYLAVSQIVSIVGLSILNWKTIETLWNNTSSDYNNDVGLVFLAPLALIGVLTLLFSVIEGIIWIINKFKSKNDEEQKEVG